MGPKLAESPALRTVLDQFDQPAYLCTRRGEVRFANRVARRRAPSLPSWLLDRVRSRNGANGRSDASDPHQPQLVSLDGGLTLVVLPAAEEADAPSADALASLPPRLSHVAELVAAGLTDAEIADHMGLTHKTVRTYVTRIYKRLGVSNRVMLTRLLIRV